MPASTPSAASSIPWMLPGTMRIQQLPPPVLHQAAEGEMAVDSPAAVETVVVEAVAMPIDFKIFE